jgi:hypothetical protein
MTGNPWRCVAMIALVFPLFLLVGCSSDETALVLEVERGTRASNPDEVIFRVHRTDIASDPREAVAPLTGPAAKTFPLQLVLVADGGSTATFEVGIEGRQGGVVVATGVPAQASSRIAFVAGQVVTHRFMLNALGPSTETDASPPPMTVAPSSSPADAGAATCATACMDDCQTGVCTAGGTCEPAPDGTPCSGKPKKICRGGACVKAEH